MHLEDLTTKNYGDLKPIKYLGDKYWLCKCKCNKEIRIRKSSLTRNYTNYICKHKDNRIDLQDKIFGDIKVIEYKGNSKWLCECKSGFKHEYESKYIRKELNNYICKHNMVSRDSKFIDLTNKIFGDLKVEKYLNNGLWLCKCKCGKEISKQTYNIRNSTNICNHNNISNDFKFIDLTNKQFGDLIVKEYLGNHRWLCECKCGYTFDRESKHIRNNMINYKCIHLTGKKFGKLSVIKKLDNRLYECTCDCGNTVQVFSYNLTYSNTKSCGCLKDKHIMSKDEVVNAIKEYTETSNNKPMVNQLYSILGVSYSTSLRYIKEYDLYSLMDTSFKSSCERDIYNIIKENSNYDIIVGSRSIIDNYELGIYIPEKKLAIEFNGDYWHSNLFKDRYYHQNKTIACAKKGIRLVHIFEHELYNENTRLKTINFIKSLVCKNNIYGRNTYIDDNINIDEIKDFENNNHLQGYIHSKINIGLRYNNKLVGLITFGKPRFNSNYQYEVIRMCFDNNTTIVGGAEKMFKYFVDKYNPESIITYVDIAKFNGNTYTKLGFKAFENPITKPNYVWVDTEDFTVLRRYKCQKHKLISKGLATIEDTEDIAMNRLGYLKIYDSGNLRLVWNK